MAIQNCWEYKKCGREIGGTKTKELGECPAATATKGNGLNRGKNGGRACWAIAGTLCGGKVQGSFAMKVSNCLQCEFYQLVRAEEGVNLVGSREIISQLLG
jgi:coenzyme F420-reducing hydrogenase beta subunit